MRLYLETNSEVRSQIRNIQLIINIIFSKYFYRFLRKKNNNKISLLEICFLVLRLHFLPIDIGSPAPEKQSEG